MHRSLMRFLALNYMNILIYVITLDAIIVHLIVQLMSAEREQDSSGMRNIKEAEDDR